MRRAAARLCPRCFRTDSRVCGLAGDHLRRPRGARDPSTPDTLRKVGRFAAGAQIITIMAYRGNAVTCRERNARDAALPRETVPRPVLPAQTREIAVVVCG